MARVVAPLNFNAFLDKAKLKDDGSNFVEWARNLRIILTPAQKSYVLDAPLGAPLLGNVAWKTKKILRTRKIYPWRCIAMRGESVSTCPRRPLAEAFRQRG